MAGREGHDRVTVKNVWVYKVRAAGARPGAARTASSAPACMPAVSRKMIFDTALSA